MVDSSRGPYREAPHDERNKEEVDQLVPFVSMVAAPRQSKHVKRTAVCGCPNCVYCVQSSGTDRLHGSESQGKVQYDLSRKSDLFLPPIEGQLIH